jgi:hypothetical protein
VSAVDLTAQLRRKRRPIVILVVVLMMALAVEVGFYLGQHSAFSGMGANPETYQAMQAELLSVENALRSRDAELEIVSTRREVDRQTLELVRKELAGQNDEIAALEEGLAFYRGLMSPGDIAPGLNLHGVELKEGEQPGHYFFRIVLQQEARKHALLKGTLEAVISGVMDGEVAEYSLAELSDDIEAEDIALQFRYFQSIEGQLVLPQGFEPSEVRVQASTKKPHNFEIREEYPWQLEERFTHVGK